MAVVLDSIALALDADRVYRVGGTRFTLDSVVHAFNRGATAEEIVCKFGTLDLSDVYQVIGYYLKHSVELSGYFSQREREGRELLEANPEWSPKGFRERLLSREGAVKWLADENFDNDIVRGLIRAAPDFDIVRVQDFPEIRGARSICRSGRGIARRPAP